MLVEFTVGNFHSFKDPVTLSMVAGTIREHQHQNVIHTGNLNLLKSAVMYGANASGKSNLFSALAFMKKLILSSSRQSQLGEEIGVDFYRLDEKCALLPSKFEVVFLKNDVRYRYGFTVTTKSVVEEWLYSAKKNTEKELFYREGNTIELGIGYKKEGAGLINKTKENVLFLSVVANFNGETAVQIIEWFHNLTILSANRNSSMDYTIKKASDPHFKKKILDFMRIADFSIVDFSIEKLPLSLIEQMVNLPNPFKDAIKEMTDVTVYYKTEDKDTVVPLHLNKHESEGTKKLLALAAPVIDTLQQGKVLFVDDLDSKLHPLITAHLIHQFNAKENVGAQLIFNTHDTFHLSKQFFRRDQIWFSEKTDFGCSKIFSLVEYKTNEESVRNDATYHKDYLKGRYGAIPYIHTLDGVEEEHGEEQGAEKQG
ncbi:MAG: AAA family ATPase [Bacilli bacterium]